ncbi:hypothetical protein [Mesoterricola silvestris]|nr:hypothetical protein [Mesoterricola silvestris]
MDVFHPRRFVPPLLAACAALPAPGAGIQAPDAAWRTIATAHYRIHYPPMLAGWAQDVASRIEGIHAQVIALVGYEHPGPIQVVLLDPVAEPNGMAVPLLPYPHVTLWATEPRSDDFLGNAYSTWTEELVSHEMTHIQHLTRTRRPRTALDNLFALPLGPLVLKCPRWVTEGYATLAEGRITGSGRPHSALRAALIRQWARNGKLPPYGALDATRGFMGGSMAYQVGSAYLEWLERQRPAQPGVLRNLWKHLASKRNRSFDAAFLATFGFSAADGYQRFQAEAAHDALEWELRLKAQGLREGELFLRSAGGLRDLAVSPDGTRLLASQEARGQSGLWIWRLRDPAPPKRPVRPDPDAPEDAPPESPSRKPAAMLPALDHRVPQAGEWVNDGTVRFQLKHADPEGTLRRRPALWRIGKGVDRAPSTLPPPRWRTLDPLRRGAAWALELEGRPVPLPGQAVGRAFVDEGRGLLWAGSEVEGGVEVVKVPFVREGGAPVFQAAQVVTRTVSGAWNPAPSPDGRTLFFTTLDARGMEIRRLDLALPALSAAPAPEPRFLTTRTVLPPPVEPVTLPQVPGPLPSTPYRAAENGWIQIASGATLTPSGSAWQLGLAGADLLGRLSWQVLGGSGDDAGPRGAMAGVSSAAWAWRPALAVFTATARPSRQSFAPVAADTRRQGGEVSFTYEDRGDHPFWFSPVAAFERVEPLDSGPARTRGLLGLRAGMGALKARGPWGLALHPQLQAFTGTTGGNRWNLVRADLSLRLENPAVPLVLRTSGGRVTGGGAAGEAFHLGGTSTSLVPASLDCGQVEQPALPSRLATGDRFLRWRGEAGGALHAYLEGSALWDPGAGRPPFTRVAGLEFALDNPLGGASEAVLRRLRIQAGIHRPLDGVMKGRTVGTLALVVRP